MFTPRLGPVLAVIVLSLGACGGSTVYTSDYASLYEPGQVRLAVASGPALAVIRDNPFPSDFGNQGVLAAMQGRTFGPKMYFTQAPRPEDIYGYKVVMDFGESQYGTSRACTSRPTPPARSPPRGRITASAAFCIGDSLLSDAVGAVDGVTGPDDPRFRALIGDLMVALTPPFDPKRRGDDCRGPGC